MTTVKLYALSYRETRTYSVATLFAIGNLLLPLAFHLIPQGGLIFLPIYFFTLIAAYKYGWRVGLLSAVLSPLANFLLFGMPAVAALPSILIKSSLLAFAASMAARQFQRVSILILVGVVLAAQIVGTLVDLTLTGNAILAFQDFRIGTPGMAFQAVGGYLFIKYLLKD